MYERARETLGRWLALPDEPPTLPAGPDVRVVSFHPDRGFLRYLQLAFWSVAGPVSILLLAAALSMAVEVRPAWLPPLLLVGVLLLIVGHLSIRLRFDMTWYVMSDRSLRLRRGVFAIEEKTMTFENIQNVKVRQGPLQRFLGISNVILETAGSGTGADGPAGTASSAVIEGVTRPEEIREQVLLRVRRSRSSGLGDEEPQIEGSVGGWTREHLEVLREIRDAAGAIAGS